MTGQEEIQKARAAGFSDKEIVEGIDREKALAGKAGFSPEDVDKYYGKLPFDAKPIADLVRTNLQAGPKPATNFIEAVEAGLQMSVSGLLARGKEPQTVITPDTPRMSRIAGYTAQLAGDIPAMVGGALLGAEGGPVTATAGAFALPAGLRKILMDKYEKGEVSDFGEFWERLSGAVIDTAKGWITGAATAKVGGLIGATPIVSPTARIAATTAGEITTMVTVGSALEGKIPSANDFIDTALSLGFVKGSVKVAGKMREIYARTGTTPDQIAQDAQQYPDVMQDLASEDRTLPKRYEDALADELAKSRRETKPVERRPTGEYIEVPAPQKSITELAKESQYKVKKTSEAGTFLAEPYAQQRLHQEGSVVTRPITEQEEVKQYAATAFSQVFPEPRGKHEVTDTAETPAWYRNILDRTGEPPWAIDRSLERLRESGEPQSLVDKVVLDEIVNNQELIRIVAKLPKEIPDTQLERSQYEKSRAFRTAEEILQERNVLKSAEEMISQEPRPSIRERQYILPKGRGPVIDKQDMAELTSELTKYGIVWNEEGKPKWEENVPIKDAQQQILDRIVQHEPGSERLTLSAIYTSIFDNLNPIKKALKTGEKELPTGENPYDLQRLTRGTMGKANEFLKYGAFDFNTYKTITRGYEQILEPVKKDLDGFRAYMAAKRTIEKEGQGITTGFPLEAAKQVVKEGKDIYETVFQERLKYRDALLGYLQGAGILSQRSVDAMKEANKDYVPFYRFFEEEGKTGRSTSTAQVKDPIKEMKGGTQKIEDPIVSDIKDTFLFIGLAERNAARQAFVVLGPEFAEPIRSKSNPITKKEVKDIVNQYGVNDNAANAIAALRPASFRVAKNELVVFEKGERTVYKVDPTVTEAFEDVDRTSALLLARMIVHTPSALLRAGVTLSPDFMVRNILRDAISSFVFAGSHPVKTVKGMVSLTLKDEAFHNWLKGGGANATMVAIDRDYISNHIINLNAETGIAERAMNVVKTPIELLRLMSEWVENSTRIGAVRDEMLEAKDKARIQALSLIAREATVDFGRHGRDTQEISKSVAFFNPALQGIDRFARAFHDNPMGTTAKALGLVTIPSLMLWWANKDDKEIQDLPRWQKDLFWVTRMPLPDGGSFILRIPKAHEIGILFGSLPERILDAFYKDNPDAFKDFDRTVMSVLLPSVVPTVLVPVVEQFANRSSFTGGPLVPANAEKLLPEYQYSEYTTETAKALGKLFGAFPGMERAALASEEPYIGGVARALTTPAYIENYVRQWTGGMGMYAMQIADKALYDLGIAPDPIKPTATLADIPVIKAFVARYPSATAQSIQDFYSNYYVSKRYFDTIVTKAGEGDQAAVELLRAHADSMVQLDGMRETLTGLSKLVHDVNKNPLMTPSDKRQLIDTMYYNMIEIARAGNTVYRELGATK